MIRFSARITVTLVCGVLLIAGAFFVGVVLAPRLGSLSVPMPLKLTAKELKDAVEKRTELIALPRIAGKDALVYAGARNIDTQLALVAGSNLVATLSRIDWGESGRYNLNQLKKELDKAAGVFGIDAASADYLDLVGHNSFYGIYGKKEGDLPAKYLLLFQPSTARRYRAICQALEENAFPLVRDGLRLFIANGNFIVAVRDTIVVTNDSVRLRAVHDALQAFPRTPPPEPATEIERKIGEIYADRSDGQIYFYVPVDLFLEKMAPFGMVPGQGAMEDLFFDRLFFSARLTDPVQAELCFDIIKTANESLNAMLDLKPQATSIGAFVPADALFWTGGMSLHPAEWHAYTVKTAAKARRKRSIGARIQTLDAAAVLAFLKERCNVRFESDIAPLVGGEFALIFDRVAFGDDGKRDIADATWSFACVVRADDPAKIVQLIAAKADEANAQFKRDVQLFVDEDVPALFAPLSIRETPVGEGTVIRSIDLSRFADLASLHRDTIEYAVVGPYFVIGSDIRRIVETYLGKGTDIRSQPVYRRLFALANGGREEVGMVSYFNTAGLNEVFARALAKSLPKAMQNDQPGAAAGDKPMPFLGWIGDVLTVTDRRDNVVSCRFLFSLRDMPADDWLGIFRLMGLKERQKV